MGTPMAANIARAGFELTVLDTDEARTAPFLAQGAAVASSIAEVGARADCICIAVHDDDQIDDVVASPGGLLGAMNRNSVIVVFSTATPAHCEDLARRSMHHGIHFLDAPVSGGYSQARDGTLTLAVGGTVNDVTMCRPVLDAVATRVFHAGGVGSGQLYKLLNNAVGISARIAIREMLGIARAAGIDEDDLLRYVSTSTGDGWHVRNWRAMQDSVVHSAGGAQAIAETARKDLQLALQLATELETAAPLLHQASLHTDGICGPNG